MMRVLCVRVLDWPFVARLAPAGSPDAVVAVPSMVLAGREGSAEPSGAVRVDRSSAAALARGVAPGTRLAQARAQDPTLQVVTPRPGADREAFAAFLEVFADVTPVVEEGGDGLAFLGLDGVTALHGGLQATLDLVAGRCRAFGWPVAFGLAGGRFAALTAASLVGEGEIRVVPDGEDRAFLAPLPVDLLPLDHDVLTTLHQVGLATMADLAAVDPASLVVRFGEEAAGWTALARAEGELPLTPHPPHAPVTVSRWFDDPVTERSRLLFALESAVDGIVGAMTAVGRGVTSMLLRLHLDDGERVESRVGLARPTAGGRTLLDAVRGALEGMTFECGCVAVDLLVVESGPVSGQGRLFPGRADGALDEAWDELLERLRVLAGEAGVGCFELVPGHTPEDSWRLQPWGARPTPPPRTRDGLRRRRALLPGGKGVALRLLPAPAAVRVEAAADSAAPGRVDGASVVEAAGPFRMASGWWRGETDDRYYFEALTADGLLLWVFRRGGDWYLQGIFD